MLDEKLVREKAAEILERDGWTQYSYHGATMGVATEPGQRCGHCTLGAMIQAVADLTGKTASERTLWEALGHDYSSRDRAILGRTASDIIGFNDADSTTVDDVVKMLRGEG